MRTKMKNGKEVDLLKLTTETGDADTIKLYQLLYFKIKATSKVFDPLKMFHDEDL